MRMCTHPAAWQARVLPPCALERVAAIVGDERRGASQVLDATNTSCITWCITRCIPSCIPSCIPRCIPQCIPRCIASQVLDAANRPPRALYLSAAESALLSEHSHHTHPRSPGRDPGRRTPSPPPTPPKLGERQPALMERVRPSVDMGVGHGTRTCMPHACHMHAHAHLHAQSLRVPQPSRMYGVRVPATGGRAACAAYCGTTGDGERDARPLQAHVAVVWQAGRRSDCPACAEVRLPAPWPRCCGLADVRV